MTSSLRAPLRYSLRDVEKLLGLSRSTRYTRIAEGKLVVHKDGRRTFVSAAEPARYLGTLGVPGLEWARRKAREQASAKIKILRGFNAPGRAVGLGRAHGLCWLNISLDPHWQNLQFPDILELEW